MVILGGLVLLGIGSAAGASVAEENDAFCAVCHVNPERTYVERARTVAQAYDVTRGQGVAGDELWLAGPTPPATWPVRTAPPR